jgi:hypothetical protein
MARTVTDLEESLAYVVRGNGCESDALELFKFSGIVVVIIISCNTIVIVVVVVVIVIVGQWDTMCAKRDPKTFELTLSTSKRRGVRELTPCART